jgi:hypothetical protein
MAVWRPLRDGTRAFNIDGVIHLADVVLAMHLMARASVHADREINR